MIPSAALTALVAGVAFGLSLIVAFGAQNSYVLRQGLLSEHVLTVVVICALSDVVLIAAGVAGASAALQGRQWLLLVVRIGGAAFLFGYAVLAVRRLRRPPAGPDAGQEARPASQAAVVATSLAFTWLNPAVYLDTVVLLGSVASTRAGEQWWFAAGAMSASLAWFAGLGFGARLLSPVFRRPRAWQALDGFVAVVMVVTGLRVLTS